MARASTYSVLNKIMDIAPEILIGGAVDVVVRQERSWLSSFGVVDTRDQILVLAALTLVVWGLESLFEYLHSVDWRNLAQTLQHEVRVDAYSHVQSLDMAYFEDQSTGSLMAVLNDDVNQLERFLDVGANDVIQTITSVVGVGVVFFLLSPTIALLSFIPIPLIVWGSIRFTRRMAVRYRRVRDQAGALGGILQNNLGGISTIKAFTAEQREVDRVAAESEEYRVANREAIRLSSAFVPVIRIGILIGFLVTLLYGGFRVLDGTLEVAAYSVLIFLTQRLLWPLTSLGQTLDLYQRSMASTARIMDLLDTDSAMPDGEIRLSHSKGHVRFEDVSFSYTAGLPVLENVTVDIPAGHTVALVGSTGSGKTTLSKLLMRFADVDHGTITVDGHDVRDLILDSLRGSIGLVGQDVFLFHGTVAENIAYGKPSAARAEIERAAERVGIGEIIAALPDGYDTVVGERGSTLSGGQRQRVALARALLRDPRVLILDDATSSVDAATEAEIRDALGTVMEGRTTIIIAHRTSTLALADRIVVLDGGRIVGIGTHDELLETLPRYAEILSESVVGA